MLQRRSRRSLQSLHLNYKQIQILHRHSQPISGSSATPEKPIIHRSAHPHLVTNQASTTALKSATSFNLTFQIPTLFPSTLHPSSSLTLHIASRRACVPSHPTSRPPSPNALLDATIPHSTRTTSRRPQAARPLQPTHHHRAWRPQHQ